MTVTIAAADDFDAHDRLLAALAETGATAEPIVSISGFAASREPEQVELGLGLNEFFVGSQRLTVYRDAWQVDLEGPDNLVKQVVDLLR
jgi:hypothetical protein